MNIFYGDNTVNTNKQKSYVNFTFFAEYFTALWTGCRFMDLYIQVNLKYF